MRPHPGTSWGRLLMDEMKGGQRNDKKQVEGMEKDKKAFAKTLTQ